MSFSAVFKLGGLCPIEFIEVRKKKKKKEKKNGWYIAQIKKSNFSFCVSLNFLVCVDKI